MVNYFFQRKIPALGFQTFKNTWPPAPCRPVLYPKYFGSTWIVVLIELGFNKGHWKLQVHIGDSRELLDVGWVFDFLFF